MRRHRLVVSVVLVLAAALGAALPVLAAGTLSANLIAGGQYVRPAALDCPLPDRMWPDEPYPYACPPPVKLPPLPGRS